MEGTDSKKMFIETETGETGKVYINFSSQKACLSVYQCLDRFVAVPSWP